jgi:hypothetical protein
VACPQKEKERALKNECFGVFRDAQAVEQSFAGKSTQHEIEILVPLLRVIQEPLAHRRSDIARSAPGHVSISRYGRITFPTRQILA